MRSFVFIFVALFTVSTSVAFGAACDNTVAAACAPGKTGANDLTCMGGPAANIPLCLIANNAVFACKANAEVFDTTPASGTCTCATGHFKDGDECTACGVGSYKSNTGNGGCTPCAGGRTSTDTGRALNCTASCQNNAHVVDWITNPVWDPATNESNSCDIESCTDGYEPNAQRDDCVGRQYTITLELMGGFSPQTSLTVTFGQPMPTLSPLPTRPGYIFRGYVSFLGVYYYDGNGASINNWDVASDGILFADWGDCADGVVGTNGTVRGTAVNNVCMYYIECDSGYENTTNYSAATAGPNSNLSCTNCSIGYYCDTIAPRRHPCPAGATTNATGAASIARCNYTGGEAAICAAGGGTCTKFCDSRGCFYLPTDVPY